MPYATVENGLIRSTHGRLHRAISRAQRVLAARRLDDGAHMEVWRLRPEAEGERVRMQPIEHWGMSRLWDSRASQEGEQE